MCDVRNGRIGGCPPSTAGSMLVVKVLVMAKTAVCAVARKEPFGPAHAPVSMVPGEMAFSAAVRVPL